MQKFSTSVIGILLLSVIPAILTYIPLLQWFKNYIAMQAHLPFIISISFALLIALILSVRAWVIKKTQSIYKREFEVNRMLNDLEVRQRLIIAILNSNANNEKISLKMNIDTIKQYLSADDMAYLGFKENEIDIVGKFKNDYL